MIRFLILLLCAVPALAQPPEEYLLFSVPRASTGVSDVTNNMVAWWKFEEGSGGPGTTTVDSTGNGHDGTLVSNVLWGTGKVGDYCIFVRQNTNYVLVANPGNVLDGSNITVTAWVSWTNNGIGVFPRIIDRVYNGQFYVAAYITNSTLTFGFNVATGGSFDRGNAATTPLPTNEWVHIAVTWDGTKVNCYTNGVAGEEFTPPSQSGGLADSTSDIRIGQRVDSPGNNRGWNGAIDDLRVYNWALSAANVKAVYDATK